jgi:hypothetical protein
VKKDRPWSLLLYGNAREKVSYAQASTTYRVQCAERMAPVLAWKSVCHKNGPSTMALPVASQVRSETPVVFLTPDSNDLLLVLDERYYPARKLTHLPQSTYLKWMSHTADIMQPPSPRSISELRTETRQDPIKILPGLRVIKPSSKLQPAILLVISRLLRLLRQRTSFKGGN